MCTCVCVCVLKMSSYQKGDVWLWEKGGLVVCKSRSLISGSGVELEVLTIGVAC